MNDAVDVDTIVAGIILCGGKSTRMGGPKESLPLGGGVTMLGRVVEVVSAVVSPVVVVAAVGQKLPALPEHIRVVRDDMPDVGPLQGLATGLRSLQGQAAAAYVSSCDVPLLRPEFIVRLAERLEGADIAVPFVNENRIRWRASIERASWRRRRNCWRRASGVALPGEGADAPGEGGRARRDR